MNNFLTFVTQYLWLHHAPCMPHLTLMSKRAINGNQMLSTADSHYFDPWTLNHLSRSVPWIPIRQFILTHVCIIHTCLPYGFMQLKCKPHMNNVPKSVYANYSEMPTFSFKINNKKYDEAILISVMWSIGFTPSHKAFCRYSS